MNVSERDGRESVRVSIRMGWDDGDVFGSAMGWLGGLCDVLTHEGMGYMIPESAGYRAALGGVTLDSPEAEQLVWELAEVDDVSVHTLQYWAEVMSRYLDVMPADRKY